MEVQIDGFPVVETQPGGSLNEGLLQPGEVNLVERIRVGGECCTLGQDIEAGKKPKSRIKSMLSDMSIAFGAQKLQGKKGQEVIGGGNDLGAGQTCCMNHFVEPKLGDKGSEQKDSCTGGFEAPAFQLVNGSEDLGALRHLHPSYGKAHLQAGAARKPGESLFRKHPFHGAHGKLHALLTEEFHNLSGGKPMLTPSNDFATGVGAHLVTTGFVLLETFRQIDLAMPKLMAKESHVARRETKALGNQLGRQPIDEKGSKSLITTLPGQNRLSEIGRILHQCYNSMTLNNVNTKI